MDQHTANELTMLKGVSRFILENTITPPIVLVTELKAEVDGVIDVLESAASTQVGGTGDASGGTATRREIAAALRGYMKDVCRIGRTLDAATHPGLAAKCVLPRSRSYPATIAGAQALLTEVTPLDAVFVAHGMAATFLADMNALIAAFEAATHVQLDGQQMQVEGTALLKHRSQEGLVAATKLDAIIRAHFRDDPVKLAVWAHARHVERDPVREGEEDPETPPDSGSGSGTTAALNTRSGITGEGGTIA